MSKRAVPTCPSCLVQQLDRRSLQEAELDLPGVGKLPAKFLGWECKCGAILRDPNVDMALVDGGKPDDESYEDEDEGDEY